MDRLKVWRDWIAQNPLLVTRLTAALVALLAFGMLALRIIRPDEYAVILNALGF